MKSLLTLALALVASTAFAADYKVDAGHTNVNFTVRHMISKVSGQFKEFEGAFKFDAKKSELSDIDFTVIAKSIDTNVSKRDDHLRSPDFFDVDKFGKLTFKSDKAVKIAKNKGKLTGTLTIRDVSKPVKFDLEYLGADKDPWGNSKAAFTATTKISRKDYGLTWNKTLESGNLLVGDEVTITLQVEADEVVAKK